MANNTAFYRSAPPRDDELGRRGQDTQRRQRERSADDAQYAARRRRRLPQRRDSYSSTESESEPEDRRRDKKTSGRRAQSEQPRPGARAPRGYDGDYQGVVARNLDSSPNGVLAAAVGAGIGAIGARRYGGGHYDPQKGNSHWKTIGGAVVGGIAANAAENRWHKYREEKKKSKEGGEDGK